jgi:circadian clock protein KaiC
MTAQGEPGAESADSSGVEGLDHVLRGGFPRDGIHLIQGGPGTGKTTLGLQYLLAGTATGDKGLYLTAAQTRRGLERIAHSHGWSLDAITVHELSPPGVTGDAAAAEQTVLHTADLELDELGRELRQVIERIAPRRVVLDSLAAIRLLAGSTARFHREVVRLRQLLIRSDCNTLFLSDSGPSDAEAGTDLQSLATSAVSLEQIAPDYGDVRRRLQVIKIRGVPYQGGYHYFRIRTGGLEVYPRLVPDFHKEYTDFKTVPSGIETLDHLLGGGLELGTTCLFIGPPGTGKSTLAAVFARSAGEKDMKTAFFLFDERPETFKARSKGLGIDLKPHMDGDRLSLAMLDPGAITSGQFAQEVRRVVEEEHAQLVVIDSLTGYFNAMGNSSTLPVDMHELLTFLSRSGVLTILIVAAQEGVLGLGSQPATDISYLSDSVIVTRMFEADGVIRRCMAAIKKRQGEHETTIREVFIKPGSVDVSKEPLRKFRGLLGGQPEPLNDSKRQ